ncbi:serine/threonine kinase-like domain-containing protein STKLD1 isoform X2 [Hyla sarda]|uniref:serine/threonine kinase-like domain-containing protein STKLD1 isoform X2 n=1 Tax=Hyla sarda TaxID=327740 RepID=UPI0024C2847B|nr:serine/threonine kinase-like domain-containing protein STKLD1 isoform X2 [Hyla sarda]
MGTSGRCGRKPIRPKLNPDMDKYRVLEEWGAGAFGVTCLVEEIEEGRKYAVKKVECIDEQEANLALEEAKSLLELQHPHICSYKEFFMLWDHKISSLFFCLVMDYCDHGNLEQIVRENRRQGKIIDEKIIQRFLGQTIDALIYVHNKSVTHRNLKPSNILMKREDFFVISDFLPQTLATDEMKLKIRVDPERKIFMAPESLESMYTDKSDIWSLGCILLDLMTTSIKTDAEIVQLLEEVKLKPLSLQKNLEEIQDKVGYSEELRQLLPKMLKLHSEERPSATDLLREPYVIQFLALIGSSLSGIKKTLPPGILDELKDGNVEKVMGLMKRYPDFEDAQLSALKHLTSYDSGRDAMEGEDEDEEEQRWAGDDLVITLVEAVRTYPQKAELISVTFSVMIMISASAQTAEMLRRTGFLLDLVRIMARSLENRDMCQSCCALLWSLAMTENQTDGECLKDAVPVICALLTKYRTDGPLVESACTALWILGVKGHIMAEQTETVTLLLLAALKAHSQRPVLAKNVCSALTSLVVNSELAAYRVLVPAAGASGLSVIKELYRLHADDPEIVENICLLFSEMAYYGSTHAELLLQHVDQLLGDIKERFESLEEITTLADTALSRLKS